MVFEMGFIGNEAGYINALHFFKKADMTKKELRKEIERLTDERDHLLCDLHEMVFHPGSVASIMIASRIRYMKMHEEYVLFGDPTIPYTYKTVGLIDCIKKEQA